jgi:hypothetical protein
MTRAMTKRPYQTMTIKPPLAGLCRGRTERCWRRWPLPSCTRSRRCNLNLTRAINFALDFSVTNQKIYVGIN